MSESENDDDDYCPTVNDEKMFNQEVGENDNKDENNKTGMTQTESKEADEILKSFKLNLPINEKSPEKKTTWTPNGCDNRIELVLKCGRRQDNHERRRTRHVEALVVNHSQGVALQMPGRA